MELKRNIVLIIICLLAISGMILNAQGRKADCSRVEASKVILNKINDKGKPATSEQILNSLNDVINRELISNFCWGDEEFSKLVGRNIAILITNRDSNPEIIMNTAQYIKKLDGILLDLLDKWGIPASKYAIDMYSILGKELKGTDSDIGRLLTRKGLLEELSLGTQRNRATEALKKMELIAQDLLQHAQEKEAEELRNKQMRAINGRLNELDSRIEEVNKKIGEIPKPVSSIFIIVAVAAFLVLILLLLFIAFNLRRLKEAMGGKIKESDIMPLEEPIKPKVRPRTRYGGENKLRKGGEAEMGGQKTIPTNTGLKVLAERIENLENKVSILKEKTGTESTESEKIKDIQGELKQIKDQLGSIDTVLKEMPKKFSNELDQIQTILKAPQTQKLDENHNKIKSIEEQMNALPEQITEQMVDYERQILKEIWNLRVTADERTQLISLIGSIKEQKPLLTTCYKLETEIGFNREFASYYRDVLKPLKHYEYRLTEIRDTREVMGKKRISENPARDLFEIKQKIYFLVFMQHLDEIPELLSFNIEQWFSKKFLNFADQFLRHYQKEVLSGTRTTELEKVNIIINEILSYFDLEPIPISLGQTQFDSSLHIGQSKISDTAMSDGVIAEVIKNGFRKKGGDAVIQPEVIVNRV